MIGRKFKSNRSSIQCGHTSGVSKKPNEIFLGGTMHTVCAGNENDSKHQMNEIEMELIRKN